MCSRAVADGEECRRECVSRVCPECSEYAQSRRECMCARAPWLMEQSVGVSGVYVCSRAVADGAECRRECVSRTLEVP